MKKVSILFTTVLVLSMLLAACGGAGNNGGTTGNNGLSPTLEGGGLGTDLPMETTTGMETPVETPMVTSTTSGTGSEATPMTTSTAADTAAETPEATATTSGSTSGGTGSTGGDTGAVAMGYDRFSELVGYTVVDPQGNQVGDVRGLVIAVTGSSMSDTSSGTSGSGTSGSDTDATATPAASDSTGADATATPASGSSADATATPAASDSGSGSGSTGSSGSSGSMASTGESGEILYVVVDRYVTKDSGSGSMDSGSTDATATPAASDGTGADATATPAASGSTDSGMTGSAGMGSILIPWTAFNTSGSGTSSNYTPGGSDQSVATVTPDSNGSSDNGSTGGTTGSDTTATPAATDSADSGSSGSDSTGADATATPAASDSTGSGTTGSSMAGESNVLVLAVDVAVLDAAPMVTDEQLAQAASGGLDTSLSEYWASQGLQIPATGPSTGSDQGNMVPLVLQKDFNSMAVSRPDDTSTLGTVQDFIVNRGTGAVEFAVLNVNSKVIPVPMSAFEVQVGAVGSPALVLDADEATLTGAPAFDNWDSFDFSESGWESQYHDYWQSK